MSGHSKWSQIKHKKGIADVKRSKIFSKIARIITIAARAGGPKPEMNPRLRLAIDKARAVNMPSDNIERAIKKGAGVGEGEKLEEAVIEAFGPHGTALIIEAITDNKNRTVSEIRNILSSHNGKLANEGSVKWLFDLYGKITVLLKNYSFDALETLAIELDSQDIKIKEDKAIILTKPEDLDRIKKGLEAQKIIIETAELDYIPKNPVKIEDNEQKADVEKLFEELDENDDVQEIYSNLED